MEKGKATEENSMAVPQKMKHQITNGPSNFTSGYTPKITESKNLKRYLYTHVHNIIHTSQKVLKAILSEVSQRKTNTI